MKREIATGIQDFESIRVNRRFYVDKTDFISKWWNGGDVATLITRPRRFGKTLNRIKRIPIEAIRRRGGRRYDSENL